MLADHSIAAENSITPRVEIGANYDSNPWLLPDDQPASGSVAGAVADVSLQMQSNTPRSRSSLTPRVHATQYGSSDSDKESTDLYLSGSTSWRSQRSNYGLDTELSRQGVSSNEVTLAESDLPLGSTSGGESGLIYSKNTLKTGTGRGTGSWTLSQRSRVNLGVGYTSSTYDQTIAGAQNDYSSSDASLGLSFRTSERIEITPSVFGALFRPESGFTDADTYGARLEIWRETSQRSRAFLRLGVARSTIDSPARPSGETKVTEPEFGGGFERTLQRGALFAQYTHALDPNGSGSLLIRDDAYVRFTHNFSQRVSSIVTVRAVWASAADELSGYSDRTYVTGSAGIEWRLRRAWSVQLRYGGAQQDFDDGRDSASSHAVTLSTIWQPRRDNR